MPKRPLLSQLIDAFQCLPGVGPKSAQRMAYYLLERDRDGGRVLSRVLLEAMDQIGHCEVCRTLCETSVCEYCSNPKRDTSKLCIVETPAEVLAIEQATDYRGHYFVLGGRLSPLDGIGPYEIGLEQLQKRLLEGSVSELILATSTTVEGEATAHYISEMIPNREIKITRIAYGVPLGGELEYVDGGTLSHAFRSRLEI